MSDNTATSFHDKWHENPDLAFTETLRDGSDFQTWILSRNGFASSNDLRAHLAGVRRILDAGCGNGRVTALLRELTDPATTEVVGIDLVAADVALRNLQRYDNVRIETADLLADLTALGDFDFIYCQEVLHHTTSPRDAFLNLARRLSPGGELAIYVYKQKAPVREFVDDYVRDRIAPLPYDEAMRACAQITALGRALAALNTTVDVEGVDLLEIPAGTYDVQRLLYHFFMKCYWNPTLSHNDNTAINYDWYHPQLCARHTPDEVQEWFAAAGLRVVHTLVDFYGITARGVRADQ